MKRVPGGSQSGDHTKYLEAVWRRYRSRALDVEPQKTARPVERLPAVELRGIRQKAIVNGVEVEPLSGPIYEVIKGLLNAGPDGLSKKQLEKINPAALKYLRKLRKSSPHWEAAIIMAGKAFRGYSIRHA